MSRQPPPELVHHSDQGCNTGAEATYPDLEHLVEGIGAYIEDYYNRTRLHSALAQVRH